jgi:SAM-dependent methyltransferase
VTTNSTNPGIRRVRALRQAADHSLRDDRSRGSVRGPNAEIPGAVAAPSTRSEASRGGRQGVGETAVLAPRSAEATGGGTAPGTTKGAESGVRRMHSAEPEERMPQRFREMADQARKGAPQASPTSAVTPARGDLSIGEGWTALTVSDAQHHRVLHVGCGSAARARLHPIFRVPAWREIRLDIDAAVLPDIVSSIVDMRRSVDDASCDAVWSSHNLEHLPAHEVVPALSEFVRVLKPTGFALMRCPDIEAVAEIILRDGLDHVVYTSPAGPVTALDMLYGHGASIEGGNSFMRHGTGFTQERLGRVLIEAGFAEVRTTRTPDYNVWAAAFMPQADVERVARAIARTGVDLQP